VTILRALTGGVGFIAGVWLLADLPIVNPWPALVIGWTLLLTGIAIAAPALVDWIEGDA
jgi:uncharacterized membrane protein HdeD (DUF308 family)